MVSYLVHFETALHNATYIITKYNNNLSQNASGFSLQNFTIIITVLSSGLIKMLVISIVSFSTGMLLKITFVIIDYHFMKVGKSIINSYCILET